MKKFIKISLIILAVFVAAILGVLYYHDFFTSPKLVEKEMGPYTFATKRYVGPYYETGPTMDEVDSFLREMGVESTKGVGLYYDDPDKVAASELRSDVGNVLEGVDEETLSKIKEKFNVIEFEKANSAVVEFPIKSMLSYMIAPMKTYPVISNHWLEKGYREDIEDSFAIEIYDIPAKVSTYIMPIK